MTSEQHRKICTGSNLTIKTGFLNSSLAKFNMEDETRRTSYEQEDKNQAFFNNQQVNLWQFAKMCMFFVQSLTFLFSHVYSNEHCLHFLLFFLLYHVKNLIKSMHFYKLLKIDLLIVRDCPILILMLITHSLHLPPLNSTTILKILELPLYLDWH